MTAPDPTAGEHDHEWTRCSACRTDGPCPCSGGACALCPASAPAVAASTGTSEDAERLAEDFREWYATATQNPCGPFVTPTCDLDETAEARRPGEGPAEGLGLFSTRACRTCGVRWRGDDPCWMCGGDPIP